MSMFMFEELALRVQLLWLLCNMTRLIILSSWCALSHFGKASLGTTVQCLGGYLQLAGQPCMIGYGSAGRYRVEGQ